MNVHFQGSTRLGRLVTALGGDELALARFSGTEHINTLFEYRVEAISTHDDIDFDALIGTAATVELDHPDQGTQFYDGIVTQARYVGIGENGYRYDFDLRPWLWLSSLRRNQQIFHRMSVVEILSDLWAPYDYLGAPAFELRLSNEYPELEYTVQFGESDLNFACRMMERFGISYGFVHSKENHTLILVDNAGGLDDVVAGERPFYSRASHQNADGEHFWEWRTERNLTTGAVKLTDYNFKKPGARMITGRRGDARHAEGFIESFDWPGRYLDLGRGEEVEIGMRVDQERGQDRRHYAEGNCLSLRAGQKVRLSGDPVHGATDKTFICLSANHSYAANTYSTVTLPTGGNAYTGTYVFMPVDAPLAPRRKTPLALVQGPQTATVVGEGEVDCDEYGRILVRFHWDLDHAHSMRCRVSQSWAGNGWGGMVIPRIGMEVVVEFLDGDPDKPLVTGCVYNGRNAVPYVLPENKTVSTFKTDTHEGSGYNELRFEDKRDAEEIFLHAQKDHNTVIENDETHSIGHNRVKSVGNDQTESVGHDKQISVANDHTETIGRDMRYDVGRNQIERFGKDHIHNVGNILKQDIYADHLEVVGRNYEGVVKGKSKLDVGATLTTNVGTVHKLMAGERFEIAGPGGKIVIDQSGITLAASKIDLKGAVNMGGSGSAQVPALQLAANDALPICEECPNAAEG